MDFLTLHNAYVDEWITVSYLPTIKTTYDGELNYYDIGTLNLKNINPRNYPFSEQIFVMDRHYNTIKLSFDKLLSDRNSGLGANDDRLIRIETYQSSFQTFIERMKMVLEKVILEMGGSLPDLSNCEENFNSTHHNNNINNSNTHPSSSDQKRLTIMARSRLPTFTPSITIVSGAVSVLWNEVLSLINKRDQSLTSRNQKIQQIIGQNLSHLIFEWRVMVANSQKIFNEDKRFKKNPFSQPSFDQSSSTFQISSPVLISTSNPNYQQLMSSSIPVNQSNQDSSLSFGSNSSISSFGSNISINGNGNNQSPHSSLTTDHLENLSIYNSIENISPKSTILTPPTTPQHNNINNIGINYNNNIQAPSSPSQGNASSGWQKAFKRITTMASQNNNLNSSGNNIINTSSNNSNNNNNLNNNNSFNNQNQNNFINNSTKDNNSSNINSNNSSNSNNIKEINHNDNVPIGGIIKSGWMKKRGGKNKSWKKRFFILDMKKTLRYYNYHKEKAQHKTDSQTNLYNISNPILQSNQIILNSNGNIINPSIVNLDIQNNLNQTNNNSSNINNNNNNSTNNNNNPYILNSTNTSNVINQQTLNNQQTISNLPNDVTNFENLKYKGSIDLYTSLVVAIKPNTSNINLIAGTATNVKDDSGSYFGMDIITPKRIWHLCCDSQKSMDDWLLVLKSANK